MIGPSGCGKSTLVRCINRMHEEIPGARADGTVLLDDVDLYDATASTWSPVRRAIGMVFQKPNPFPTMSIFDNVAAGLRLSGRKGDMHERVEQSLRGAGAVGGGQGPPRRARDRALRRPAAAAVHRAHDRGRARGDPDGRAVLRAGPDRHAEDRGADRRPQAALHDRDRHAQHAAGRARGRQDGVHAQRASSSSSTRPRRSSPTRRTRAPRSTSPASSGRRRGHHGLRTHPFPGGAAAARGAGARRRSTSSSPRSTARWRRSHHQDIELAAIVVARRRPDRRPLPGGPPGDPVAAGAAGAGGVATCASWRRCCT